MIGKLKCWFRGKHLRGKFVRALDNGRIKYFACPCCGRETSYRAPRSIIDPSPQVGIGQAGME